MWHYSTGTRQELPSQLFERMGHYRREVFINQLGWELNTVDGMELDEFDGPDAVYVCSHDDEGNVSGVARLLPTTGPYLLEKVFPQLWAGKELPHDAQIWELSRFAAASPNASGAISHQADAKHASDLLRNVMRTGLMFGAQRLVGVSTVAMERFLRLNGCRVMRAGVPIMNHGIPIVSLSMDCTTVSKEARGSAPNVLDRADAQKL